MTLALVAAIGVLVGWFGRPLWAVLSERVYEWHMRRHVRRSPSATLASVAETYKRLYGADDVAAARPAPSLRVIRKSEFAESGMDCWNCGIARGDGKDACDRHAQTAKP